MGQPIVDIHQQVKDEFYKKLYADIDRDIYLHLTGSAEFEPCKITKLIDHND